MILALIPLLSTFALQEQGTDPDPLSQALQDLGAIGLEIDSDELFVETASRSYATRDIDAQQSFFFEPGHFHALWVLYRSMGLETESPEAFRQQVSSALANGLVAYYAFDRNGLVRIDNAVAKVADEGRIILHELVHAWQDQQRDLEKVYAAPTSFEAFRALQCLVEGEAEAVTYRVELERRGIDSTQVEPEEIDNTLAKLTVGAGVASMYSAGRNHCLRHVRDHGWGALSAIYDTPLPSTEEILHPSKLGKDRPLELTAPDWPAAWGAAELIHEDTLGELGIFGILNDGFRVAAGTEDEAWRAVIGWDGDRYRCWRTGEDEYAFAWRIVFDRELDAEQFEATWKRMSLGRTRRKGRSIAWALAENRADELAQLLLDHEPISEANADDAASTQALEDELPDPGTSQEPHIDEGRWHVPAHGFSIPLPAPEGWQAMEIQGTPFLIGQPHGGFTENINATPLPLAPGKDIKAILAENEAFFEADENYRLHSCESRMLGNTEVAYITYGATMNSRELEFRVLVVPAGKQQLVLTATLLNSRAGESAPLFDKALLGFRFER